MASRPFAQFQLASLGDAEPTVLAGIARSRVTSRPSHWHRAEPDVAETAAPSQRFCAPSSEMRSDYSKPAEHQAGIARHLLRDVVAAPITSVVRSPSRREYQCLRHRLVLMRPGRIGMIPSQKKGSQVRWCSTRTMAPSWSVPSRFRCTKANTLSVWWRGRLQLSSS
jgi:hypothetical protein